LNISNAYEQKLTNYRKEMAEKIKGYNK